MSTGYPPELAGKFVLLSPDGSDDGGKWQGQMVSDADTGIAFVQLYSWLTGEKTVQKLVTHDQLMDAEFFDTQDEWHAAAMKSFQKIKI